MAGIAAKLGVGESHGAGECKAARPKRRGGRARRVRSLSLLLWPFVLMFSAP
jgi:hypothetical protein